MSTEIKTELPPADVNRRLAEALGWKRGHSVQWTETETRHYDWGCSVQWTETETRHYDWGWTAPDGRSGSDLVPPPYCSDLNAVAEARKALTEAERWRFVYLLIEQLPKPGNVSLYRPEASSACGLFHFLDAPAETQARAILAVLEGRKP